MKRSGSKIISRAGSVRNIAKPGYRFAFELVLESCDSMLGTSDVVCTCERRGQTVVATEPAKINRARRIVSFNGAVLRREVTLFKRRKSDEEFENKIFTIAIRQGSATGRVVGKIQLDFSEYAQVPSSTKRIRAKLSSGSLLIMSINSTYIGEVARRQNGKSSTEQSSASASDSSSTGGDLSDSDFSDITLSSSVGGGSPLPQARAKGTVTGKNSVPTVSTQLAGREKEKEELRRVQEENRALRREVQELNARLDREPEYADVVRELRETKVALAILSLERDELVQQVRKN